MEELVKKIDADNEAFELKLKQLENRISAMEKQEEVRERNYFNLTADEKHIINKFMNKTTISAECNEKRLGSK